MRPLGPLYTFLNRKWYWDELYNILFIRPTLWFSEKVAYEFVDKGLIDGILHLIARAFYGFGNAVKWFEQTIIGDGVDWVKDRFLDIAREFRYLQTGKVQEYVLITSLFAVALAVVILLLNSGLLAQLFQ